MSVFDRNYRRYTGELKGRMFKIWSIATTTFRVQFSGKKIIFLLIFCNLPVISFTLMLIFTAIFFPAGFSEMLLGMFGSFENTMYTVINFSFNAGLIFLPIVFICALNAGTIANDKKNNSLALYMARPINRVDYVFGKAISVYMVSSFVTFIPWFVFLISYTLLQNVTGAQFLETLWVYLSTIAAGLVIVIFMGSIVLMFSSMSKNSVLGGILAILLLYLPSLLTNAIATFTQADWISYFSVSQLISSSVYFIFGSPTFDLFGTDFFTPNINGGVSTIIMVAIGIICVLVTINNLYKEEIN